jgi:hypothetical protein
MLIPVKIRAFKGVDTKEILKKYASHVNNADKGVPYTFE